MSDHDYIKKIAIIGGAGGVGSYVLSSLVAKGVFEITAVSRSESTSTFPDSIRTVRGDYSDEDFLVQALTGQDALVIALGHSAAPDVQSDIIRAAAKAEVKWILPNEWGSDTANEKFVEITGVNIGKARYRKEIEELGVSSWIAINNNPFYGFCLSKGMFKVDSKNRKATLYDGGDVKFSTSTFTTIGATVAALLSLPVNSSDSHKPSLSQWKNKQAYVSTFRISQRDVLDAVQTVTKTTDSDWTIEHAESQPTLDRHKDALKNHDMAGIIERLCVAHFVEGLGGDFVPTKGNVSDQLGVPKEDLVEETRKAIAGME